MITKNIVSMYFCKKVCYCTCTLVVSGIKYKDALNEFLPAIKVGYLYIYICNVVEISMKVMVDVSRKVMVEISRTVGHCATGYISSKNLQVQSIIIIED